MRYGGSFGMASVLSPYAFSSDMMLLSRLLSVSSLVHTVDLNFALTIFVSSLSISTCFFWQMYLLLM